MGKVWGAQPTASHERPLTGSDSGSPTELADGSQWAKYHKVFRANQPLISVTSSLISPYMKANYAALVCVSRRVRRQVDRLVPVVTNEKPRRQQSR
jgi:hypothetical protein